MEVFMEEDLILEMGIGLEGGGVAKNGAALQLVFFKDFDELESSNLDY